MTAIQFELVDDGTPSIYRGPTLFKLDSVGRLRGWRMEIDDAGRYRTHSGLIGGKFAESGWTTPVPASKPTQKEQGEFEVRSQYQHQLDREYHETADTVSQPKMIEPMLAKTYSSFPGPGTFDPKLDGIRMIATAAGLFSRQGQRFTSVPHIERELESVFAINPDAILDGEAYNHDFREDFGAISSLVRKKNPIPAEKEALIQYHVYDLVSGTGNRGERKRQLSELIARSETRESVIKFVDSVPIANEAQLKEAYARAVGDGYEGGIYAPDGYSYELGRRSKGLLKMKDFITQEFKLLRLEEGNGNWAGAVKRAVLQNDEGAEGEFGAGIRGSYAAGKALMGADVTDKSTATVRFFMRSPDGVPRFPVVIDIQLEGRVD